MTSGLKGYTNNMFISFENYIKMIKHHKLFLIVYLYFYQLF